jgi:xanthine dehydrogenase YagS FAD-binding subunit
VAAVAQDPDTTFLSSGTNLIDLMKVGVARPSRLVDITCLPPDAVPSGSWGGRYLSLGDYVTGTGPRTGRPPPEGVHVAYPQRR